MEIPYLSWGGCRECSTGISLFVMSIDDVKLFYTINQLKIIVDMTFKIIITKIIKLIIFNNL